MVMALKQLLYIYPYAITITGHVAHMEFNDSIIYIFFEFFLYRKIKFYFFRFIYLLKCPISYLFVQEAIFGYVIPNLKIRDIKGTRIITSYISKVSEFFK